MQNESYVSCIAAWVVSLYMWPCNVFAVRRPVYLHKIWTMTSLPENSREKNKNRQWSYSFSHSLSSKAEPEEDLRHYSHNPVHVAFPVFLFLPAHTDHKPFPLAWAPRQCFRHCCCTSDLDLLWCSLSHGVASVLSKLLTYSSSLSYFFHVGPWC